MVIRIQLVFHGRLNCFFFFVFIRSRRRSCLSNYVRTLCKTDEWRKCILVSLFGTAWWGKKTPSFKQRPHMPPRPAVLPCLWECSYWNRRQRWKTAFHPQHTHTHTPISHSCQSQSKCTTQSNHRRTTLSSVACRMRVWEKIYGENPKVFKTDYSLAIKYHFVHYS